MNAVKVFPNGDVLTGCADRVARIWTRRVLGAAPLVEREAFDNMMQVMGNAEYVNMESSCYLSPPLNSIRTPPIYNHSTQAIDVSSLPDASVLQRPGTRNGEAIAVNVAGRGAIAYAWNDEDNQWIEVIRNNDTLICHSGVFLSLCPQIGEAFAQAAPSGRGGAGDSLSAVDAAGKTIGISSEIWEI